MLKQTLITKYFIPIEKIKLKKRKWDAFNSTKQSLITKYFKTENNYKMVFGFNPETYSWHCMNCGVDMGYCNPRQLCGKIFCRNI
jgi:hypothetical protein